MIKISDKSTRSNETVSKLGQIRASSDMQTPSKRPKVSVIMSVFNEEDCVGGTIESVLNQTFSDFEFIIINDCSTDGTRKILESYASKDRRIKILINKENMGAARSSNRGVENSKGEYIARIDAADICHPSRLEKQARFLDENKNVYVVGSYHYWTNEKGQVIGAYCFPTTNEQIKKDIFGFVSVAAHPAIMFRREIFERTGPYNTTCPTSTVDYELYLRTLKNGWEIANIPEFLVFISRRKRGISIKKIKAIFINQVKMKARYMPYLFNFQNLAYTIASLFFVLMPSPLLEKIVDISIAHPRIRSVLMKI